MSQALTKIEIPNTTSHSGKVREIFDVGDKLLFVASDRISASIALCRMASRKRARC